VRILYIHQYFATPAGSTGTRSYEFGRRWVETGHTVEVLTSGAALVSAPSSAGASAAEPPTVEGIRLHVCRVPYRNEMGPILRILSFLVFSLRATLRGVRLARPDVVFATSTPLTVGIPAVLLSWRFRCPLVFEVRDLWPEGPIQLGWLRPAPLRWAARWLERWIYRHSDRIVALSPGMAEGVLGTGFDQERLRVIPNCSDNAFFDPDHRASALRRRHGIEGFVAVYAGALGVANRVRDLLEVCEHLRRAGAPVTVAVVGAGREEEVLRRGVEEAGLDNLLVIGEQSKIEVREWIAASDLGLVLFDRVPILETNSPNKFFDYCAGGRPTLINIGGWIADVVEEEGIGFAVRDGDPEGVAEVLVRAARMSEEELRRMGRRAREVAETRFDRDLLAQRVLDLLEEAAEG
jgi:glycosyltransferase involved in cell wall biosynthesis